MKTTPTEKRARRISLTTLTVLLSAGMLGCSSSQSSKINAGLDVPKQHSAEIIAEYRRLANEGYQALEAGEVAKAVQSFSAQLKLVPEGKLGAYNLACVYGRTGDTEKGLHWLAETVANGWDSPDELLYDTDLASLSSSPEFDKLVALSEATRVEKDKMFAAGLPEYATAPVTFATQEELDQWRQSQSEALRANSVIWQGWQYAAASLDFYARHLAAERELRKDDPDYDYGLSRVRAIGNIKTIWDCWGSLSDGVVKEAESYLASVPSQAGANEANYLAGMALAQKYCDEETTTKRTSEQIAAHEKAQIYFASVSADSRFKGSADAFLMDFKLAEAAEEGQQEVQALYADVRTLIKKCREDKDLEAMQIISVSFQMDAISSLWPLDLNQPDFAGENVSLTDYKGKVVLIDFWATWCGPCLAELPNLKSVYETYHQQGLEVISVSLDYDSRLNTEQLRQWTKNKGMPWRHIYEGKGWDITLADRFLVKGIPAAFLVGRDGSLVAVGVDLHGEHLAPTVMKALAADFH